MKAVKLLLLTIFLIFTHNAIFAQIIWQEYFSIAEKGIWGDADGVIHQDLQDINWTLLYDADSIMLSLPGDYAKTVSTSGGRFECRDIDGKITWVSEIINIIDSQLVNLHFVAKETGSGKNEQNKYLRSYVKVDDNKQLIATNSGNWGNDTVKVNNISGKTLQIIVEMCNHYANDKVIIDEIIVEKATLESPQIDTVEITAANQAQLIFSENIAKTNVTKANFLLTDAENNSIEITRINFINDSTVLIDFELTQQHQLTVSIIGIADELGNITRKDTYQFEYFAPANYNDIIFNELMIDPTLVVQLSDVEYIELFNRSDVAINLKGWRLMVNNKKTMLPDVSILPKDFLILIKKSQVDSLSSFKNVVGLTRWLSLRNTDATLALKDQYANLIDTFAYDRSWMTKLENSSGGYSLERMDANRYCYQPGNWLFSQNVQGGTPGSANSVKQENIDTTPPTVLSIEVINETTVAITFSEAIEGTSLANNKNYQLDDNRLPGSVKIVSQDKILLKFVSKLTTNQIYTLTIDSLVDNCANKMLIYTQDIQWNNIEEGDILINEILFNPVSNGADYIEIYNQSNKNINLKRLYLVRIKNDSQIIQAHPVSEIQHTFQPKTYLTLTKDTNAVFPYFTIKCYDCFWQMEKFPTFPNAEGIVALMNEKNEIIDRFDYSEKMHHPIYWDKEGVSLERFSFADSTNNIANWHSAASIVGYGTPGYENSQVEDQLSNQPKITFEPESFSPNLDNYNDNYLIHYQLDTFGYVANVVIFNAMGNRILTLTENELLSVAGTISWNGEDETGSRLPLGVYVVLVKLLHPDGKSYQFKHAVVLTDIVN